MSDLLANLLTRLQADLDTRGRAHADCPFCGHEVTRRGYHFYVYAADYGRGYVCWSCGARGSLVDLARHLDITGADAPTPRPAKPAPTPPWAHPDAAATYRRNAVERADRAIAAWQTYKPLGAATITRYGLSIGQLPLWAEATPRRAGRWYAYRHERLLVPLWRGDQIVGLVGRAIHPQDDGPKWLTASYSDLNDLYPLPIPSGRVLILCENRIDALLATERDPRAHALAIGGARWRSDWTAQIAATRPQHVLIWLDHDLAGNGSRYHEAELLATWRARIAERRAANPALADRPWPAPPQPRGPQIANDLLAAGVPASLYVWPRGAPPKADLGWALMHQEQTI